MKDRTKGVSEAKAEVWWATGDFVMDNRLATREIIPCGVVVPSRFACRRTCEHYVWPGTPLAIDLAASALAALLVPAVNGAVDAVNRLCAHDQEWFRTPALFNEALTVHLFRVETHRAIRRVRGVHLLRSGLIALPPQQDLRLAHAGELIRDLPPCFYASGGKSGAYLRLAA